jgi:hypothetical protein
MDANYRRLDVPSGDGRQLQSTQMLQLHSGVVGKIYAGQIDVNVIVQIRSFHHHLVGL